MKSKKLVLLVSFVSIGILSSLHNVPVSATKVCGLTLQVDQSNEGNDAITFNFDDYAINANYLGINLNPESAVDKSDLTPKWTMLQLSLTDSAGNVYTMTQTNGETTSSGDTTPAFDYNGNYTGVTYGYSYIWPLLGFVGTVYIPYSSFLNKGHPITKGTTIKSVTIKHNSKSNSRKEMTTHIFDLSEADVTIPDNSNNWIGDVKLLHNFDKIVADNCISNSHKIVDFSKLTNDDITKDSSVTMYTKELNEVDYNSIINVISKDNDAAWRANYTHNGQKFTYSSVSNGIYNEALYWKYGMYFEDYDSSVNTYGSLTIKSDFSNWQGALGLTIYVENLQSYPASFNLEFSEIEDGGYERWNLNSDFYRRVYAYNVETGEEFGFNTLTVIELPANFKGWLRIPFSEYGVPNWSAAHSYNDSILSLEKPHTEVYLTSQFLKNDSCCFIFDNLGLFFEEFQAGKLFDKEKKSIKECLEIDNYVIGGNN